MQAQHSANDRRDKIFFTYSKQRKSSNSFETPGALETNVLSPYDISQIVSAVQSLCMKMNAKKR